MNSNELMIIGIVAIVLLAVTIIAVTAIFVICTIRLQSHDVQLADIESRLENIAQNGPEVNRRIRELNNRVDNIWKNIGE